MFGMAFDLAMMTPNSTSDLKGEAQRIHRIAELLSKAVMLAEAKRMVQPVGVQECQPPGVQSGRRRARKWNDQRVLRYIQTAGQASPVAIRTALGLSRSAAYRSLTRLSVDGEVTIAGGQGSLLVYRLNQGSPPPDKIGLN